MTLQTIEQTSATEPGAYDALMEITRRPPITFTQGRGGWLWDSEGKRYLDFVQGWAVNCLGHCPPAVASVLVEQSTKLLNCSPAFYNEPMVRYAEELTAAAGLDRVFFANSGAEANEGAIKLARKWAPRTAAAPTKSSQPTTASTAAPWQRCRRRVNPPGTNCSSPR